jgi:hypothetical protein
MVAALQIQRHRVVFYRAGSSERREMIASLVEADISAMARPVKPAPTPTSSPTEHDAIKVVEIVLDGRQWRSFRPDNVISFTPMP